MAHVQRRKDRSGWIARYPGPDGKERSRSFRRKVDAEKWLTTQEGAKLRGEWVDPALGRTTFTEWVDRWKGTLVDIRRSSLTRKLGIVDRYLLPRFGPVPLARITLAEAQGFIGELQLAEHLRPATVRKVGQVLSAVMTDAARTGYIPRSPCDGLRLPQEDTREMRFLNAGEVEELAERVGEHFRPLVYAAAYGGPRWGELAGLRPERLNLFQRTLQVTEQLTEVSGELAWGPPKTPAARRTVSLPRFLTSMLEDHLARPAVAGSGLVFPSTEGTPLRRSNFRRRVWLPAVRSAGLEGLRFHDLRHTAVAFAIAQGAHPKSIQQRLGHSAIAVTLDRYGHLFPSLDEKIAEGLDAVYEAAKVEPRAHVVELRRDADGTETGRAVPASL